VINIAKPEITRKEIDAVVKVLESGQLVQGSVVKQFEDDFAAYCGSEHAIALCNGTTALQVALLASGIGPGDEVITTPFTFMATVSSIIHVGAIPVFCDIDPKTFNINVKLIPRHITCRIRAIMPVHLYGQCCDMEDIVYLSKVFGLKLIEDACQAHGASRGKKAGTLGDLGCFSFYPTKNMTTGEGGMIVTDDDNIAKRCRLIRSHGQSSRYEYDMLGFNYRMTNIAAAIGIEQLKRLDDNNKARMLNAEYLDRYLNVKSPFVMPGNNHVYHQYTIRVKNRDEVIDLLQKNDIGYGIYYPKLIYDYEHMKRYTRYEYPEARKASREVLSLPVHPGLSKSDLDKIIDVINSVVK